MGDRHSKWRPSDPHDMRGPSVVYRNGRRDTPHGGSYSGRHCFFCRDGTVPLKHHATVPLLGDGHSLLLCQACRNGCYARRYQSYYRLALYDARDQHETICAVCSKSYGSTPVTLVLCDGCRFSYCAPCLRTVLSPAECQELEREGAEWTCPVCRHGVPRLCPDTEEHAPHSTDGSHSLVWLNRWKKLSGKPPSARMRPLSTSCAPGGGGRGGRGGGGEREGRRREGSLSTEEDDPEGEAEDEDEDEGEDEGGEEDEARRLQPPSKGDWAEVPSVARLTLEDLGVGVGKEWDKVIGRKADGSFLFKDEGEFDAEMEKEEAPPSLPSSTVKRKRADGQQPEEGDEDEEEEEAMWSELPPVDASKDHLDFFGQYVRYIKDLSIPNKDTENSCFLCKDGGNLLECDWDLRDKHLHCKKVYHEYCLNYAVSTNPNVRWHCPRHLCAACAEKKINFCCRYCPNSYCLAHVPSLAHLITDQPKPRELAAPHLQEIVCPDCVRLVIRARYRQELKPGFCSVVDNIQHDYIDSLSQPQHLKEGGVRPFHPVLETRFVVEGQDKPWADEEEEVEGGEKKVEGEGGKGGKRSRV